MEVKINNAFYSCGTTKIIDNINLKIYEGEVNAFIGSNTGGKSTLANMIVSKIFPQTGFIDVGRYNVSNHSIISAERNNFFNTNIGLLSRNLKEKFFCPTVEKELETTNCSKEKINSVLKMINWDSSYLNHDPTKLSTGEKTKLSLAKLLLINPKIIILDEPTIGLDSKDKDDLIKLLRLIKRKYNKTIIVISQDMDFINRVSDYIFLFNKGKLIMQGEKYDILKQEKKLKENGIVIPKIIRFELFVHEKKNIRLGFRNENNDLIKDILRNI